MVSQSSFASSASGLVWELRLPASSAAPGAALPMGLGTCWRLRAHFPPGRGRRASP